MIIVKVGVRKFLKENEVRASSAIYGALDLAVQELLRKAAERAKANHRRVVTEFDV